MTPTTDGTGRPLAGHIDAWHAQAIARGHGVHAHHIERRALHPSSRRLGQRLEHVTATLPTIDDPWDALRVLRAAGTPIGIDALSFHGPGDAAYDVVGDVRGIVVVTCSRFAWRGTFIDPFGASHRILVWTDSLPFDMTRLLIAGTN